MKKFVISTGDDPIKVVKQKWCERDILCWWNPVSDYTVGPWTTIEETVDDRNRIVIEEIS